MSETELPSPPIPADADLRDFPFTPIFRARLFGSSFHSRSTDAEWRAGVTLWLKSWDQSPAGSLPDDEIDLCRLAELGRDLKTWRKVKAGALRGWIKHSDGRLYHEVVAEGVLEALDRKLLQRWKRECERIKKHNQRHGAAVRAMAFEDWKAAGCPKIVPDFVSSMSPGTVTPCPVGQAEESPGFPVGNHDKGQEKGQGQGQGDLKKEKSSAPGGATTKKSRPPAFDALGYLIAKGVAEQVAIDWLKQRKAKGLSPTITAFDEIDAEVLLAGIGWDDAIRRCCLAGWGGFRAKWLENEAARDGAPGRAPAGGQPNVEARNAAVAAKWVPPEMREGAMP